MALVRPLAVAAVLFLLPASAFAQPELNDLLDALGRSAAIFSRSIPALTARETLSQRSRFGDLAVRKRGRNREIKDASFTLPDDFEGHEVVSEYSFSKPGAPEGFHEVRHILTIDTLSPGDGPARHFLTLGVQSPEDDAKKRVLEEFDQSQLQGAVADLGPLLLLFTKTRQAGYTFDLSGRQVLHDEPVLVLRYRQISGSDAVAEFRERTETRHRFDGEIWLRESNLVPARITLRTEEALSRKFTLRNEAGIDYLPTVYGLAPATVIHRQYLNQDLLVENQFTYSDYNGRTFLP